MFHPIDDCEHPLLCLPGTGIASQETAISGSCQQNLAGIFFANLIQDQNSREIQVHYDRETLSQVADKWQDQKAGINNL